MGEEVPSLRRLSIRRGVCPWCAPRRGGRITGRRGTGALLERKGEGWGVTRMEREGRVLLEWKGRGRVLLGRVKGLREGLCDVLLECYK